MVAVARCCSAASRISSAVCTGTKVAPGGGESGVGRDERHAGARRTRRWRRRGHLPTSGGEVAHRSMGSRVGPEVTARARRPDPRSGRDEAMSASTIASGSGSRPRPARPRPARRYRARAPRRRARVTLVAGPTPLSPPPGATFVPVQTAEEMREAALQHLATATMVIKAAAVADYRVGARARPRSSRARTRGSRWTSCRIPTS